MIIQERYCIFFFFFFKQKTAYEMRISDWSSDVCSSDLFETIPHPRIPLPRDIYRSFGLDRDNSMGINLSNDDSLRALAEQVNAATRDDWRALPLVPGAQPSSAFIDVTNPADRRQLVGQWQPRTEEGRGGKEWGRT